MKPYHPTKLVDFYLSYEVTYYFVPALKFRSRKNTLLTEQMANKIVWK